ncbi:MAG: 5-oxoprolinase subunit PxpB [Alcaligenaceae bacterium]|nr:5-oxoprolinase subunit PxpB [Alcaligenaceae bacterium]
MTHNSENTGWDIVAHGDRCLVIRFGTGIDITTGHRCGAAAAALRQARVRGVSDIVPTFNTVAVHYLPGHFSVNTSVRSLQAEIERVLRNADLDTGSTGGQVIELPVCYGGEYGPDLADVALRTGLNENEVIALHGREPAYVFMLGFAPGAPFMGVHDALFALPRRPTPRTSIPAGSVAIANRQTVIYPNDLPGGWHIIGRTPMVLFDPLREPATLVSPGDSVQFRPISEQAFKDWPRQ